MDTLRPNCTICGKPADKHSTYKGKAYYKRFCWRCSKARWPRRPSRRVGKGLLKLVALGLNEERIHRCDGCQNTFPFRCELHHRDRDRENNSIENIAILCPNCHTLLHFQARAQGAV